MDARSEEQIELLPARLGRALKKGISDSYDRLGLVVASSLIWTLTALAPTAIGFELAKRTEKLWFAVAGMLIALLLGAPMLAGIFRMAHKIVYRDDPSLADIFSGFRELLRPSYGLAALNTVIVGVLAVDAGLYLGFFGPVKASKVVFLIGALALYLLFAWIMATLYQLPALAAQKPMGQREGAIPAVKKSLILTFANPGFTFGLFLVILGFGILCALSVIGMFVLFVGTVSVLLTHALRELFIRYRVIEE